jgi:two-component system NtrC family sensor kinase
VADGGFVLIYADITERKRNEAEIHAARDAAEEASRTIEAAFRDLKSSPGQFDPGGEDGITGPTHRRHRARDHKNPLNFVNNFAALSVVDGRIDPNAAKDSGAGATVDRTIPRN